jgi:hypothetical protein
MVSSLWSRACDLMSDDRACLPGLIVDLHYGVAKRGPHVQSTYPGMIVQVHSDKKVHALLPKLQFMDKR